MRDEKMQENNISAIPPTPPQPTASSNGNANGIDQAQFEADKRAVYKHPLFSLLALMLEKCEQATQGYVQTSSSTSSSQSNSSSPNGTPNGNCDNDHFSRDIHAFVQLLEKEKRPLLTNNAELDGLMIKALQVLRIHLLELEKVQELCRDFCTRYIACLRGKMHSENLLRSDYPLENNNNNLSNSNSPVNSPEQESIINAVQSGGYYGNTDFLTTTGNDGHEFNNIQVGMSSSPTHNPSSQQQPVPSVLSSQQHQHQQHSPDDNNSQPPTSNNISAQILGSTPLSQIGCPPLPLDQYSNQLSPCGSSDDLDSEIDSNNDDLSSNFSSNSGSKRQKRGILPKQATSVMRAWLFQHLVHPYPTEDEKRSIAAQTNLTLLQVNNWFINARRRILQPMLEHANDNTQSPARKKTSSQTPSKRFWTDTVPSHNNHPSLIDPNIENINVNINRASDSERNLAHKHLTDNYYSSDDSNDSLVIDHDS